MVKDREQLLLLAEKWTTEAKNDIRKQAIDFMTATNMEENDLAFVLGISQAEMECILRGSGDITISTLAKLLIACNFMLEVKPLDTTIFAEDGYPTPETVKEIQEEMMSEASESTDTRLVLDVLTRAELVDEVLENYWEDEIDLLYATNDEIIDFLVQKAPGMYTTQNTTTIADNNINWDDVEKYNESWDDLEDEVFDEACDEEVCEDELQALDERMNDATSALSKSLKNLSNALKNNPHLANILNKIVKP